MKEIKQMKLKIALLQISPEKSLEENLNKGINACRSASKLGADIALFPEMWNNGYDIYNCPAEVWQKDALAFNGDFVNTFGLLAKELNIAIGITFLEKSRPPAKPEA